MDVWTRLGLPEVAEGRAISSPFREDKNPSLQVGGDRNIVFDHARDETLDTIGLVEKVMGCGFVESVQFILEGNGHGGNGKAPAARTVQQQGRTADDSQKFWGPIDKAGEAFEGCHPASIDGDAVTVLQTEYGILPQWIPGRDWRVAENRDGKPGIVVRGVGPDGKTCAYKWKPLQRNAKGKRVPMYFAGSGGALVFRNEENPTAPLVIVAGEEKAIAAHVAGFAVLSPLTGEGKLSGGWVQYLVEHMVRREVIVAHDNDKAGREANEKTVDALKEAGYPVGMVRAIEWPKETPEGGDLNDLLHHGGIEAVKDALRDRSGLTILTVGQIERIQLPANDNMLGDRMLQRGEAALVVGQGGIGKSRLVGQLAFDAITGRPWCGLLTHCPTARWLVFQTENSARRLQFDQKRMLEGLGEYDRVKIERQFFMLVPMTDADRFLNFGDAKAVSQMMRAVHRFRPDVVVFDPFIEFYQGDSENDSKQMIEAYRIAMKIVRSGGSDTACVIVHHAKAGKAAIRDAFGFDAANFGRGSKALYASVRSAFNVVPGSEADTNMLVVKPAKNNNGKLPPEVPIRLSEQTMRYEVCEEFDWQGYHESLRENRVGGRRGRPPSVTFEDLKEAIPKLDGAPKSEVIALLAERKRVSESTTKRIVNAACKDGRIVKQGRQLYYPEELESEKTSAKSPGEMEV